MRSSDSARDASAQKVWHRVCSGRLAIRHIPQLSSKFQVRRSLSRVHDLILEDHQFPFEPCSSNFSLMIETSVKSLI